MQKNKTSHTKTNGLIQKKIPWNSLNKELQPNVQAPPPNR